MKELNKQQKKLVETVLSDEVSYKLIHTNASPGSGKTFTILEAAKKAAQKGEKTQILVFNRVMSDEIKSRVKKEKMEDFVQVRTIHSFFLGGLKLLDNYNFKLAYEKSFFAKSDIKQTITLSSNRHSDDVHKLVILERLKKMDESLLKEKNIDILYAMVNAYYSTPYSAKNIEKIESRASFFHEGFTGLDKLEVSDELLEYYDNKKIKGLSRPKEKIFYSLIANIEFLANNPYQKIVDTYYRKIPVEIQDKEGNVINTFYDTAKTYKFEKEHFLKVPHIYYYKNFYIESLKNPELLKKHLEGAKNFFVDEAQDNEQIFMGILNIIMRHKIVKNIACVGDTKQAIYSFKSAGHFDILSFIRKNATALEKKYGYTTISSPLPFTYRFGKDLAGCINRIFEGIESDIEAGTKNSFLFPKSFTMEDIVGFVQKYRNEKVALITRSNYEAIRLFLELNKKLPGFFRLNSSIKEEIRGFRKKGILAISDEKTKLEIVSVLQKENDRFSTRTNFSATEILSSTRAKDILRKKGFAYLTDFNISAIDEAIATTVRGSDKPVITTSHLSKGKEFDHVILADDFYKNHDFESKPKNEAIALIESLQNGQKDSLDDIREKFKRDPEEDRIYFVAMTRAKKGVFQLEGKVFEHIIEPVMDEKTKEKMMENYKNFVQQNILTMETWSDTSKMKV